VLSARGEGGIVKNFFSGLLLGILGAYWYLTQAESVRLMVNDLWIQASSPAAPIARRGH
jgi:hypothetical protein